MFRNKIIPARHEREVIEWEYRSPEMQSRSKTHEINILTAYTPGKKYRTNLEG